jgi:hypothetical protein
MLVKDNLKKTKGLHNFSNEPERISITATIGVK